MPRNKYFGGRVQKYDHSCSGGVSVLLWSPDQWSCMGCYSSPCKSNTMTIHIIFNLGNKILQQAMMTFQSLIVTHTSLRQARPTPISETLHPFIENHKEFLQNYTTISEDDWNYMYETGFVFLQTWQYHFIIENCWNWGLVRLRKNRNRFPKLSIRLLKSKMGFSETTESSPRMVSMVVGVTWLETLQECPFFWLKL